MLFDVYLMFGHEVEPDVFVDKLLLANATRDAALTHAMQAARENTGETAFVCLAGTQRIEDIQAYFYVDEMGLLVTETV